MKYSTIILACFLVSLNCQSQAQESLTPKLEVLSYNILGYAPKSGFPKETLVYLALEEADLVLLQEYSNYFEIRLPKILGDTYKYHHRNPTGLAIYSRWPMGKVWYLKGPQKRNSAQCTIVNSSSGSFALCNAHFMSPAYAVRASLKRFLPAYTRNVKVRTTEWLMLHKWYKKHGQKLPFIIAGDFNTMTLAEFHDDKFKPNFIDVMTTTGSTGKKATFPNPQLWDVNEAILQLDYILVSKDWQSLWARTENEGGSDHFPVRAQLTLRKL